MSADQSRRALQLTGRITETEVKAAYYRLAKQYHPDCTALSNKDAAVQKFRELTQARDFLLSNAQAQQTSFKPNFTQSDWGQKRWKNRESKWKEARTRADQSQKSEETWRKRQELGLVLLGAGSFTAVYVYAVVRTKYG
jgi:curved DNA-binding protein CbpA